MRTRSHDLGRELRQGSTRTEPERIAGSCQEGWQSAQAELMAARRALAASPVGIARQPPHDRLLEAQERCTRLVHGWFASALELEAVSEPRQVLALDVDGVLEDEEEGFSSMGLAAAAALRLLQLGRVGVIINTARSASEVWDRVAQLGLLGGVGGFGAALVDGVFGRQRTLLSNHDANLLGRLRAALRSDPSLVIASGYRHTVRVSRMAATGRRPIRGSEARQWIDQLDLPELNFWVASAHTDFVSRRIDKGSGLQALREDLGLTSLRLAAMGDSSCDIPMFRQAQLAFAPSATVPGYSTSHSQRLYRSRSLGGEALWDAACHLVPQLALQRQVRQVVANIRFPEWLPPGRRRRLPPGPGLVPRLAAALGSSRSYHWKQLDRRYPDGDS